MAAGVNNNQTGGVSWRTKSSNEQKASGGGGQGGYRWPGKMQTIMGALAAVTNFSSVMRKIYRLRQRKTKTGKRHDRKCKGTQMQKEARRRPEQRWECNNVVDD